MSEITNGHPLYDAAVGWMVSERTDKDSWETVVRYVHARQEAGDQLAQIKADFKVVEQQIKSDFTITQLPIAWRTAKSIALKAVAMGLPLLDGGDVIGKTELDNRTKGSVPRNSGAPCSDQVVQLIGSATRAVQKIAAECAVEGPIDREVWETMKIALITCTETLDEVPHA